MRQHVILVRARLIQVERHNRIKPGVARRIEQPLFLTILEGAGQNSAGNLTDLNPLHYPLLKKHER